MTTVDHRPESGRAARRSWRFPLLVFVLVGVALALVVEVSHEKMKQDSPPDGASVHDYIGGWMQYDTGWYVSIAEHGYDQDQVDSFKAGEQSAVAYFPGYPLAVRQVARVTDDDFVLAAEITTVLSGLAVFLLFWLWCAPRMGPAARRTSLLLLALYPYAWFIYGTGYGDALFIALTIGAFLLLERDRPVLAGLVGAAASATRLIGVGTILGLIVLVIERRGAVTRTPSTERRRPWSGWQFDRSKLRGRDAGVLLSFAGIASYSVYLSRIAGDALAFVTVQAAPGWNQGAGPKTWIKYEFFALVAHGGRSEAIRLLLEAALCVVFVLAIPLVAKRIGAAYTVYTVVIIAIPLIGSSTMQGFGRYLISAFPVFAVGGIMLADRARPRRLVLASSGALLFVLASFFGRAFYLS